MSHKNCVESTASKKYSNQMGLCVVSMGVWGRGNILVSLDYLYIGTVRGIVCQIFLPQEYIKNHLIHKHIEEDRRPLVSINHS